MQPYSRMTTRARHSATVSHTYDESRVGIMHDVSVISDQGHGGTLVSRKSKCPPLPQPSEVRLCQGEVHALQMPGQYFLSRETRRSVTCGPREKTSNVFVFVRSSFEQSGPVSTLYLVASVSPLAVHLAHSPGWCFDTVSLKCFCLFLIVFPICSCLPSATPAHSVS